MMYPYVVFKIIGREGLDTLHKSEQEIRLPYK